MAREPSEPNETEITASTDETGANGGNSGLLHRRAYLKMAGAATAGLVGAAATGTAAAADDYEVVTIPAGQREVIRLDSGETFENVLFDQTAPGSAATIIATGTDWTIRNVAWKGEFSHHDRALGVADTGNGTSRIENVYMGDGVDASVGNRRHPKFGLWVSPDHNGHLDIERMYVEGAHDNAFYGSAPGSNGNGKRGTIHYNTCYAQDCWVSCFRIARGRVENCTAVNTSAGRNGRPIWVWSTAAHGDPVEVIDCNFVGGGYPYAMDFGRSGKRTEVYLEGTHHRGGVNRRGNLTVEDGGGNGTDPDPSVPDGVPTSPEGVFDGSADGSDTEERTLPNTVVFDGRNASGNTNYEFTVSEDVRSSTDDGATIDAQASIDGSRASGVVANWLDAYRFSGQLETLSLEGDAAVRVNGVEIDPQRFADAKRADRSESVLVVRGAASGVTRYEFVAGGDVERTDDENASIDPEDVVDGNAVRGTVGNWKDAFRFDGELEELSVDGPGTIVLDGEEVDPDAIGR
ncbi:right-handed parallel beta-helix repeat-containing protein [Halomontanus rarus]|uniref:right-handed parallel beta-helix repeat-containing protein n=1 Tax=Halomontanus rarus TaxID=3034020 RepID=UPI0023E847BA|nr:right-handed parallel beta-helix repeat-containing protein [Halovivax sp. TS33]